MVLRTSPSGFIEPCLPSPAERLPGGPDCVHEIKHDGYRLMARRNPACVRLLTRNGHDWSARYPLILEAVNRLKVRSVLIDEEAVACDDNGLAVFERLRRKREGRHVFLFAFDLLELNGEDLRREPFETRKATLASLLPARIPGTSSSAMPARWGSKASSRSGLARVTSPGAPATGLDEEPRGAGGEARS